MSAEPSQRLPRILVVEDDPAVRGALQFSLELDFFTVDAFESAAALSRRGDLSSAACLVIDYHLADRNGLDLLDDLRGQGICVPAILITSRPNHEVKARAAVSDVAIVEKPLLSDALAEAIRAAIRAKIA